ncbi:hypothetical protein I5677_08160 [Mobilitalea sibirica]|uniref:DNA mismatch repair proteins mutS family domain-containing protein n=1 Tax=Mobilitalea sibirica TaxID=1462919 RepID=A0A8J7H2Q0_9FIRM|nr:hypothetical protein [Mobilitalea sibirica]MBH1940860.1 hypothetical protein [Mobilitalea sibirica]
MEFLFYILIVVLGLVIWSIFNENTVLKRMKRDLKERWGQVPEEEYTSEKFESLKAFYQSIMDDHLDVDDITWNDLDMDEIYKIMNNTQSSVGEEYLYALLRKPCFSNEELKERNRLMKFFHENEDLRIQLQMKLKQIGKLRQISVYEYMSRLGDQEAKSNFPHYLMAFGLILSVVFIFIIPQLGGVFTFLFVGNNIYRYYKRKAEIEMYFTVFAYLLRFLNHIKGIVKLDIPELRSYLETLKQDSTIFNRFKKGAGIVVSQNNSGNLFDMFLDYFRMLFHLDLIKYNSMLSFFKSNRQILQRIYINIGFLDSMIASASFRAWLVYYSEPILTKDTNPKLRVEQLYHPLLEAPVSNSINENRSVLLTGSNASGKSTFIKTLAINAVLSQTIYTSISKEYKASFFIIFSSMALRDSIFRNESYYIVEIKSLKRILDRINKDIPMLCFIDEVLRGTNTLERIAASSRILASLAKKNTLCFAATHDIELTYILETYYSNYHFQEKIVEHQILFDYILYSGRAVSKNAIKLLGLLGYSQDIISAAEQAAKDFQTNGEWNKL